MDDKEKAWKTHQDEKTEKRLTILEKEFKNMKSQIAKIDDYHQRMDLFVIECNTNFATIDRTLVGVVKSVSENTKTNIQIHTTVIVIGWMIALFSAAAAIGGFIIAVLPLID